MSATLCVFAISTLVGCGDTGQGSAPKGAETGTGPAPAATGDAGKTKSLGKVGDSL
jgi:hypothetical protein